MATTIGREEVLALARLAELELGPREVVRITQDLQSILAYLNELSALDLEGVPPTSHGDDAERSLRADVEGESLPRDLALSEAPEVAYGGFAVQRFVDEG